MNSKERVYSSLNFKKPDRVPRFIWLSNRIIKEQKLQTGKSLSDIFLEWGNDILQSWVSINREMTRLLDDDIEYIDEWGITWKAKRDYNNAVIHPLKDKNTDYIKSYHMPDPYLKSRYRELDFLLKRYGNTHFIGADLSGSIFEPAYHLRGMPELMIDFAECNECLDILLDKLTLFSIMVSAVCVKKGVDWIWLGDDVGTQRNMLISPDLWRRYLKPRLKKIIDSIRRQKKDVFICYHSCGSIYPIIEDLVEIGINLLNPIQEGAYGMDQIEIKNIYGNKISMMCGLDTQNFLINASPEQVRLETRNKINQLGYNGGYIFAASHHIQADTPRENILSMLNELDS